MVQILDIIHRTGRKNRLHKARNYLFLTLGSTFIFACIYYVANLLILILKVFQKKLVKTIR